MYERFDEKWMPEPMSGCWLWIGTVDRYGYGQFKIDRQNRKAHRLAYERWVAPVLPGFELDHLCRTRCCVNPEHLEAVTHAENVRRGDGLQAINARKTHCKHGHELAGENLSIRPDGRRRCRTCQRERDKKR